MSESYSTVISVMEDGDDFAKGKENVEVLVFKGKRPVIQRPELGDYPVEIYGVLPARGELLVEKDGYIPREIQLARLFASGIHLAEYYKRLQRHLSEEGLNDAEIDPTASKSYECFDAFEDIRLAKELYKKYTEDHRKKQKTEIEKLQERIRDLESQQKTSSEPSGEQRGSAT